MKTLRCRRHAPPTGHPSRPYRTRAWLAVLALGVMTSSAAWSRVAAQTGDVASPREVLGLAVGADSVLADWEQITRYFGALAGASPYVAVDTIGRSTLGRPLLLATITAPRHQARLHEIREAQARLADPRTLTAAAEDSLLAVQPAVVLINNNLHSTEIASSQFSMLLAHALATDPEYQRLLDSVVVLMTPSANPDGLDTVVAWYRQHRGTPFEDGPLPWLYHAYVGHDNNRDWFMLTQEETRAISRVLYRDWFPEVVWDLHQMGTRGARLFLPPFADPVNPNIDPILVAGMNLVGAAMAARLADAGRTGVEQGRSFDLWWHGGFRTAPTRHNMIGILSEAASARLASPIEHAPADRRAGGQVSYPAGWAGGRWGMPEIIDYEMLAAEGLLRLVAADRRQFVRRFVTVGRRAVASGENGGPFAFVIPPDQRDPEALAALVAVLRGGGVEIVQANEAFRADTSRYPAGSLIVPLAQPFRAHAKDLLEVQHYPDRRAYDGGPPLRPYDVTGWTLPLQFGVDVRTVTAPFEVRGSRIDSLPVGSGGTHGTGSLHVLRNRSLADTRTVAAALAAGAAVWVTPTSIEMEGERIDAGAVVIDAAPGTPVDSILGTAVRREGVSVWSTDHLPLPASKIDRLPRIGLYRSWVPNADEGWTRWILERHGIPYVELRDSTIRAGDLSTSVDVLLLPSLRASAIRNGHGAGSVPDRYVGGLGDDGTEAIRRFVRNGGTVVALDDAGEFVIQALGLPIVIGDAESGEADSAERLYAPGSIVEVLLTQGDVLTAGYGDRADVFFSGDRVLSAQDGVDVLARYAPDPLRSGYLVGADRLAGTPALVRARVGAGQAIIFGFRPQHRAQTLGTLKLLFNALLLSAAP